MWLVTWLPCLRWKGPHITSHSINQNYHMALPQTEDVGSQGFLGAREALSLPHKLRYLLNQFLLWQIRKQENGIWECELPAWVTLWVTGPDRAGKDACILTSIFSSSFVHSFIRHRLGCLLGGPHILGSFISLEEQMWSSNRSGAIEQLLPVEPSGSQRHQGPTGSLGEAEGPCSHLGSALWEVLFKCLKSSLC